ncbi:aldehyde dehydrogenase family protein [Pseudorhodoferax soli]|uniref:Benzaldehyde dehydrogenase (NAD+) n=1 Tax=Pseudorhodoferax soli TaxID=545864 RepID=A0A368XNB2_9BURK|nr:aldehyde dehydrogenase family protein [Pseudorhodoferax soli]RCW68508.1 benzaldehyde dehydrogenase (NAD+) [Pseudorhodoferax soli]
MQADAVQHPWEGKVLIDSWRPARGGFLEVRAPATNELLCRPGVADVEDVAIAADFAGAAQVGWAQTPFDQRAAVLRKAEQLLAERADKFVGWLSREAGSAGLKAGWEFNAAREQLSMAAALPMHAIGQLFPSSVPGRQNQWRRVPIGVVGVISPWNFPLLLSMRSIAPAIALGNSVILKPDPQTPVVGGILLGELFADAGLPPGVLSVLPGGAETGEAIVQHPGIRMISFTGSTAVGRRIGQTCGGLLKKCCLELGGNNAFVVLDDADLEAAASSGAWGAFLHQGQICMQAGRHLVHRSVAQRYAELLTARASKLRVGDPASGPVDLGPIINSRQLDRIEKIVRDSVDQGAKVLVGARKDGQYYWPTVLSHVSPLMPAFTEEIFGPVAPITVFDTDEEAVQLVNSSPFGLTAAIHTAKTGRGVAMALRLKTGMVHVNDQTVNNEFHVPFGGMGASGNGGRFGGPANIDEFTEAQWISVIEEPVKYPF